MIDQLENKIHKNKNEVKLSAPYYSQFIDVTDSFWMLRSCGAVCMKIVGETLGKEMKDIVTICEEAQSKGGYDMTNGWVHDYMVSYMEECGFDCYRKEGLTTIDEIIASLDAGNPVIVSVEKRVLEQKRFHMITVVGYTASSTVSSIVYHESEATDKTRGAYRTCDFSTFMEYFRGKAIFVSRQEK